MASSHVYVINGYEFHFICNTEKTSDTIVGVNYIPEVASDPKFIAGHELALSMLDHVNAMYTIEEILSNPTAAFQWDDRMDEMWECANAHPEVTPSKGLMNAVALAKVKYRPARAIREIKPVKRSKQGYVYLTQSPSGAYKIGLTAKPEDRAYTFGVKLPFEIEFLALIHTDNMWALETELHQRFSDKRLNGSEFFALAAEDVQYIQSLAGGAE